LGVLNFVGHVRGGPGAPLSPPHLGRGAEAAVIDTASRGGQHHEPSLHGRVLHAQAPVVLQGKQMQGRKAETVQIFLKGRGRRGKIRSGQSRNGTRIPCAVTKTTRKRLQGVFPFAYAYIIETALDEPLRHHTYMIPPGNQNGVGIVILDGAG